ncbi:uncharacterized protein LOC144427178 [Styela clava]
MSDVQSENVTATIAPEKKVDEHVEEKVEKTEELTADSQSDGEEEEFAETNFEADDNSEDFIPNEEVDENEEEDSCSSGEEEVGVDVKLIELGGQKFLQLKYENDEQRRKELQAKMKAEDSENEEEEEVSNEKQEDKDSDKKEGKDSFKYYRTATILDEDMDKEYKSDEDEYFDPMEGGTLTDIEYSSGDERDTESEPETETLEGKHKKTGEALTCIKMIEQLQIPPRDQTCLPTEFASAQVSDQPMECS